VTIFTFGFRIFFILLKITNHFDLDTFSKMSSHRGREFEIVEVEKELQSGEVSINDVPSTSTDLKEVLKLTATVQTSNYFKTIWFCSLCFLGVASTASLIVNNKFVLKIYRFPGAAGWLTVLHTASTGATIRLTKDRGRDIKGTSWPWLLGISLLGSLSVVTSNMLLESSSVAFHQASRLIALPLSALVDYLIYGKVRTIIQHGGLLLLILGVFVCTEADATVTSKRIFIAFLFNFCGVTTTVLVRYICKRDQFSTGDFLYISAPWSFSSSCMWAFISVGLNPPLDSINLRQLNSSWFIINLSMNLFLAFSVNWLSTWAQGHCSSLLYAVLGQVKTACTVVLGALIFNDMNITITQLQGLTVSVLVSISLAIDDDENTAVHKFKKRQFSHAFVGIAFLTLLFTSTSYLETIILLSRLQRMPNKNSTNLW
jgi:hypothetical protein